MSANYPSLYVGNLTWWTTDQDVVNAITSVGVNDVQEVKFFENRTNGQSKGFCVVNFASEASLPIVLEKLSKLELHGQNPLVAPYNRQNLSLFETQNKIGPQMNNSTTDGVSHPAGIMGINSITGVAGAQAAAAVAAAAMQPFTNVNAAAAGLYNPQAAGVTAGARNAFHASMRMQMRTPRAMMRNSMPGGPMNNGPMMPGHHMNRMRFMQPQGWNNAQTGYNPANRMTHMNMEMSNRITLGGKDDASLSSHDMLSNSSSQMYYAPHHPSSQSDQYRSDIRDHRDLRDDTSGRRFDRDDRPSRIDDRSLRYDDRSIRHDDRVSRHDDRSRRDDRSRDIRREDDKIRREDRKDDRSSRREKEEKSSRSHRERSHREGGDKRSRSRSKDRDRERDRDRDRERDKDKDKEKEKSRDRSRERKDKRERERRERY